MKPQIYSMHYPIYLTKIGSESEIVAILKVEYDTSIEDNFLLSRLYTAYTINTANTVSNIYAYTLKKIFAHRFQIYNLNSRMHTLLVRLVCVGVVTWKLIEWSQISWRQHCEASSSMYINSSGDHITILLEDTLNDSDIDILTNIGDVPVVSINKLSIKEYFICVWKMFVN